MLGRAAKTALVLVVLVAASTGFLPLFDGPGYESALAIGLFAPSACAIAAALEVSALEFGVVSGGLWRGLVVGALSAASALAVSFLHALRAGACDPLGGTAYVLLTAGIGAVAGGVYGGAVGFVARGLRRRRLACVILGLAGPVGTAAVSLHRFWASPMIFAYDPFVGFFSGSLYDTIIEPERELLTYRAGTLAALVGVFLVGSVLRPGERGGVVVAPGPTGRVRLATGLAFLAGAVGVAANGDRLGHASTPGSIARELGGRKSGRRCDVVYPTTLREDTANLLVRDCDAALADVEDTLGVRGPARVTAYFFRDSDEKRRLMGAANTYIAKPWREEVYLQIAGYPHPVLGHELAHVVAGAMGKAPFRVAGALGGLVPDPGLIEGVAEAGSPGDDTVSGAAWARAMMDLGILPPVKQLFAFSFFGESSQKAYTVAGEFVRFVMDRWGRDVIRAWYGGGDIERLTGKSWTDLDAIFRARLAETPASPEILSYARARFGRPGVFGRRCPHAVDALRRDADRCRDTGRIDEAVRLYGRAIDRDPRDFASRLGRAATMRRFGDAEQGRALLAELASAADTPQTIRDRADEALADADWLDGAPEDARARYEALAARSLDEDFARTAEVKALATREDTGGAAVRALLVGEKRGWSDPFVSAVLLGRWQAEDRSALVHYIVGRNLAQKGYHGEALRALSHARELGLPTRRVAKEALRTEIASACAMGDARAVGVLARRAEAERDRAPGDGRLAWIARFASRCVPGPGGR